MVQKLPDSNPRRDQHWILYVRTQNKIPTSQIVRPVDPAKLIVVLPTWRSSYLCRPIAGDRDVVTSGTLHAEWRYRLRGKVGLAVSFHVWTAILPQFFASFAAVTLHGCNANGLCLMPIPPHLPHQPETIRPVVWNSLRPPGHYGHS
jgi:hypothetical protein